METTTTFQKDITFVNPAFFDQDSSSHIAKEVKKLATFKELSRTDRTQHSLHFMILGAFDSVRGKGVKYNTDAVLEMTDLFIEACMVVNDGTNPTTDITPTDKLQLLNDSIGKLKFGKWLLDEKFAPFFSQLGNL